MTSYCTYAEVLAMTGTAYPQVTVEAIIVLADKELNAMLAAKGIAAAYTDTGLQEAGLNLTMARVLTRMRMDGTKPNTLTLGGLTMSDSVDKAIEGHRTVAAIVERLGYDTAREAIAEIINTVGEWDGRIWPSSREWAATIENAATRDELEAKSIYQPAEIHPAHINQLAQAMSKYAPPAPQEQEAPAQEARDTAEIMQQAGAVTLPQRVALYVPSTTDTDKPTDNAAQVERVARAFCGWFGGATAQESTGFWMSDTAGLVRESVTIVFAACTADQLRERLP